MELIRIQDSDYRKTYDLYMSFPKDENGFVNSVYGYNYEQFLDWIELKRNWSLGKELPEGFVPDTSFVLTDGDAYVGIFNLRHFLNDFLREGAGHIGYGISGKYRGKGYATKGLALTLKKARQMGIHEAYLSVHKDNPASLKVQQNNGAYIHHESDLEYFTRIDTGCSFLRLTDLSKPALSGIFAIADEIERYKGCLSGKTIVMFFPASSIRTRVSFEKGIYLLGGQSILFDPSALDKKEDLRDVCGYLQNWADAVIVRHRDLQLVEQMSQALSIPVINAMTDANHPCEMLSDLYTLSKIRPDYRSDHYLFVGADGNIGRAWKEAAEAFDLDLTQCAPAGYQIPGVECVSKLSEAIRGKDIVCTDSIPQEDLDKFRDFRVTKDVMDLANAGALLNPCPPFYRGEEVSGDVIDSHYFAGYDFKQNLLKVQQAILIYCMQRAGLTGNDD